MGSMTRTARRPQPSRPERRVGRLRVDGLGRLLPVAIALWPGSRTYTGQTMAEVYGSGSAPILRLVLSHFLARGARLAEPGEFTLRAFLSGRIDLTQSEAVLGVIDATTPGQLDAALRQLAGGLASPITDLRDRLADVLAHLEANLDFAEEPDVDALEAESLAATLDEAAAEVDRLAERLQGRERPGGRPRVVLSGPPNAGKSRLFNALLGDTRAIVSPTAGTTRDYLEAPCDCDGLVVDLVDTAGFEEASGSIGRQAQDARERSVLDCRPGARLPIGRHPHPGTAGRNRPTTPGFWSGPRPTSPCQTRPDPKTGSSPAPRPAGGCPRSVERSPPPCGRGPSRATCPPGPPLDAVRAWPALADRSRAAAATLRLGGGDELVAVDLRQGLDDLGRVVGAVVTDDLLDRIFRRFCIGK